MSPTATSSTISKFNISYFVAEHDFNKQSKVKFSDTLSLTKFDVKDSLDSEGEDVNEDDDENIQKSHNVGPNKKYVIIDVGGERFQADRDGYIMYTLFRSRVEM